MTNKPTDQPTSRLLELLWAAKYVFNNNKNSDCFCYKIFFLFIIKRFSDCSEQTDVLIKLLLVKSIKKKMPILFFYILIAILIQFDGMPKVEFNIIKIYIVKC